MINHIKWHLTIHKYQDHPYAILKCLNVVIVPWIENSEVLKDNQYKLFADQPEVDDFPGDCFNRSSWNRLYLLLENRKTL